jgi:asparaginyl-tRNA synthetase
VTSSDCEGAGETFRVTTVLPTPTKPSSENPNCNGGLPQANPDTNKPSLEFFSRPAYLTVSSQLHLEAISSSVSRVFTISPCFRAERSQTGRHLAEFWMLEAEWAFVDSVGELCQVVEGAIKSALIQHSADMTILQKNLDPRRAQMLQNAAGEKPWTRMTYTDAMAELEKAQGSNGPFQFPVGWGKPLQSEHEKWLAEQLVGGPVFVTDYPTKLKPFYMRRNTEEDTVACFDLLIPHVGELVGGSLREEREDKLQQSVAYHGLNAEDYGWYMDLRKYGGAPHGGFGLGFERLIAWLSGVENVRECIPMPRWAGRMLL